MTTKNKTIKLALGSFTRKGVRGSLGHYFEAVIGDKAVCLEACLNGYDVAIYDVKSKDLIGEKTCTNLEGYDLSFLGESNFNVRTGEALEKAIEIANKKINLLT